MNKTILQQLSEFADGLRFDDLPAEVVSKANDCFFDLVGCYYGALKRNNIPTIMAQIAQINPAQQADIWGSGLQCGSAEAALAMSTAAYHLEYDDGISVAGHWGSASIPATVLAIAESKGNGQELITALVAAYEVGTRISRIFSPRLLKKHVHFPCTMGAFAAAVGYAKGRRYSAEQLTGALSLAGLFPVGTYSTAISGADGKGLYSGWPAFLGIQAVRLAGMGLSGDSDVLENSDGFGNVLGLGAVTSEQAVAATDALGSHYLFSEVYFKPYPCCRWLHAPVHAVLRMMRENELTPEDIEKICVAGPEFAMMYNTVSGYESKVTCQYSIPYSVGAAAYYGKLGLREYEDDIRLNPALTKFIKRVCMKIDPELQEKFPSFFGVNVTVTLRDGRRLQTVEGTPWGPSNPPSKQELIDKFLMLTAGVLRQEQQQQWLDIYQNGMETEGAFAAAMALLREIQ